MSIPIKPTGKEEIIPISPKKQLGESEIKAMKFLYNELKDSPGISSACKSILREAGRIGNYEDQASALAEAKLFIRKQYGLKEEKIELKKKDPPVEHPTVQQELSKEQKEEMRALHGKLKDNKTVPYDVRVILAGGTGTVEQQLKAIQSAKLFEVGEKRDLTRKAATMNLLEKNLPKAAPAKEKQVSSHKEEDFLHFAKFRLSRMDHNSPEAKKLSSEIKHSKTNALARANLEADYIQPARCQAMMIVFDTKALKNNNPHLGELKNYKDVLSPAADINDISNFLDIEISKLKTSEKEIAKTRKNELIQIMHDMKDVKNPQA